MRDRDRVALRFREAAIPNGQVEDLVQDFFLYLLEWAERHHRQSVDLDELENRVEVFLRAHRRKTPRPAMQNWECLDTCPETPRGVERTVDTDFEQAMSDREQVVRFLHCMTEKSQLAVIVYYLVGLTREEMADLWGVSANTVATQAFRGIRQARSFGPALSSQTPAVRDLAANHRVALPMEWGTIPLELTERSAHMVCPWYDPQRARQRWTKRARLGAVQRPMMLWPQPQIRSRFAPGYVSQAERRRSESAAHLES